MDYREWTKFEAYQLNENVARESMKENLATIKARWPEYVDNVNFNMSIADDFDGWINSEYGIHEGSVIVCGAGPSLSNNIEWLKAQHESCIPIISVDKSLSYLKENGIKPLFTVTCDWQSKVADFYADFAKEDTAVLSLVTSGLVVTKVHVGTILWFGAMNPFNPFWSLAKQEFGNHIAMVREGGVVTYSAVDIAIWCGFDQIIVIGNELSFRSKQEAADYITNPHIPVRDVGNGTYTYPVFDTAATNFNLLPVYHPDIEFINMSGGSMLPSWIRGIESAN